MVTALRKAGYTELTLESLAARLTEVERKLARWEGGVPASRDWREWQPAPRTPEDEEFVRAMEAEMAAFKEAEREAARRGDDL